MDIRGVLLPFICGVLFVTQAMPTTNEKSEKKSVERIEVADDVSEVADRGSAAASEPVKRYRVSLGHWFVGLGKRDGEASFQKDAGAKRDPMEDVLREIVRFNGKQQ